MRIVSNSILAIWVAFINLSSSSLAAQDSKPPIYTIVEEKRKLQTENGLVKEKNKQLQEENERTKKDNKQLQWKKEQAKKKEKQEKNRRKQAEENRKQALKQVEHLKDVINDMARRMEIQQQQIKALLEQIQSLKDSLSYKKIEVGKLVLTIEKQRALIADLSSKIIAVKDSLDASAIKLKSDINNLLKIGTYMRVYPVNYNSKNQISEVEVHTKGKKNTKPQYEKPNWLSPLNGLYVDISYLIPITYSNIMEGEKGGLNVKLLVYERDETISSSTKFVTSTNLTLSKTELSLTYSEFNSKKQVLPLNKRLDENKDYIFALVLANDIFEKSDTLKDFETLCKEGKVILSNDENDYYARNFEYAPREKKLVFDTDEIITTTDDVKLLAYDTKDVDGDKITLIFNGVNLGIHTLDSLNLTNPILLKCSENENCILIKVEDEGKRGDATSASVTLGLRFMIGEKEVTKTYEMDKDKNCAIRIKNVNHSNKIRSSKN